MEEIRTQAEIEKIIADALDYDEYERYRKYIEYIQANLDDNGLVDVSEALMSLPQYYHISKLWSYASEKIIVVDCGCGHAIQQVLFKDYYKYIGIDGSNHYKREKIVNNVEFIHGSIDEVLPLIEAPKGCDLFGVSVLCCSYQGSEEFKKKFRYLVTI